MPAYDYLCDACGNRFEKRQKMSDTAIDLCPECGGKVRRLISGGAGMISKGSHTSEAQSACGGAPCCGQSGMCGNKALCER